MKILITSDTHMFNDYLVDLINTYKNKMDIWIHCGDSSLSMDSQLLKTFNVVVKGNHDDENFPIQVVYQGMYITHGHIQNVYKDYTQLIKECQKNHCKICIHGHTHVPTIQYHHGITFVNPGSLMMNRGSYGYGTYAIMTIEEEIEVQFYHHQNHQKVPSSVIEEGYKLLEEFKEYAKK